MSRPTIENIAGAGAWVREMEIGSDEERMLLLMGRKAEGVDEEVLGKINGCVGRAIGRWWKRRKLLTIVNS